MRAFAEINLGAIAHNVKKIMSQCNTEVLAVVKADAYGHGLWPVANTAIEAGATWLGVALLEEAINLRARGIKNVPIIAWLTPLHENFAEALNLNIDLSVPSIAHLKAIEAAGKKVNIRPRVHIEIDTGMTRGGLLEEWDDFLKVIPTSDVEVVGAWTHFARADEPENSFTDLQIAEFEKKLSELKAVGIEPKYVHLSNSAASLTKPSAYKNIVRLGIAMYGLSPDVNFMGGSESLGLKPAMVLNGELHLVKSVPAGSAVGYGGTAVTKSDTKLGIVALGYSDGIPRNATNKCGVFVAGKRAPIIGRVSMDQFVVDLGADSIAQSGDTAIVFGDAGYSIDEWAAACSTINYEIVTRIATRVPRVYGSN
jgi:alanine racemase